jgi:DNA-binding transcriptional LysR family regulator
VILPPKGNPLRDEVDDAARAEHVELRVPIEVEGIRLIADLVVAGDYASILPETAIPPDLPRARTVRIADLPPRRLAIVAARDAQMSLADLAVRDCVRLLVGKQQQARGDGREQVRSRAPHASRQRT